MTDKISTTSPDINLDNLAKLCSVFPQFVRDHKVDFDALQAFMQKEGMLAGEEKYGLSWSGKSNAFRAIRTPSTGTLTPQKSESKNWDDTKNIFIEGDNLEVLKLLQTHYTNPGKIKMIYIDPPYNTGKDFVYKDNFHENIADYYEKTGQTKDGIKTTANTEKNGRYHSDWLTMMYPRLFLARNLLRDDGVIFVSIDDNEVANLRLIMDEIFGEENFISKISRVMKSGGSKGGFFSPNIDYIYAYAKNINKAKPFRAPITNRQIKKYYNKTEANGSRKGEKYGEERVYVAGLDVRPNQRYWIKCPDGSYVIPPGDSFPDRIENGSKIKPNSSDGVWKWIFEKFNDEYAKGNIVFKETSTSALVDKDGKKSKYNIYNKVWLSSSIEKGLVPSNLFNTFENRLSSAELNNLKIPFDFAKPTSLVRYLAQIIDGNCSIILDFFAGSGTTAHAVMDLNAEDGGKRKCISVQLPELTDDKSEAYKAGYKNIADIARERIRRVGDKIGKGDIGFKSYKLSSSNYRRWHNLSGDNTEKDLLKQTQLFLDKPLVDDYKEEDVVYEILLKEGFNLNSEISTAKEGNIAYYTVQDGDRQLVVTFAHKLTQGSIKSLNLSPDTTFICLDSALDDTVKVNIAKNLTVKTI